MVSHNQGYIGQLKTLIFVSESCYIWFINYLIRQHLSEIIICILYIFEKWNISPNLGRAKIYLCKRNEMFNTEYT